jgi:aerobic-type carbon monoxide dehydrogenase small subunit (CoxS/CutS family)
MKVDVILNGRAASLEARTDEMLLAALRRHGLLSVRETCGIGVCGACTVLLDGEPVSGCLTLLSRDCRGLTPWFVRSTRRTRSSAAGAPRASCSP